MSRFDNIFQRSEESTGPVAGKLMRAIWNGQVIAESDQTVVVEGNHYFPPESVHQEFIINSPTTSVCSWKGMANYYSLIVEGIVNPDAAWFYNEPKQKAEKIRGKVAFWHGVEISAVSI